MRTLNFSTYMTTLVAAMLVVVPGAVSAAGGDEPAADFTFSPSDPVVGQTVSFTDRSTGQIDSWEWDFDDGFTSSQQNPSHVFEEEGDYGVKLTVKNSEGQDDIRNEVTVSFGEEPPEASFTFSPSDPAAGQLVQFTDTSSGSVDEWEWDFDDGLFSSARNPTHTFEEEGTYDVKLIVVNSAGSSDVREDVPVSEGEGEPEASFTYSPAEPGVGETVRFTDTSGGGQVDEWEWDFDDDDTSSAQNPSHSFSDEGDYEVRLTVTNSTGGSDVVEEITVSLNESEPVASFSFSPADPAVGQAVSFTDTSSGGQAEEWEWDFDDDDVSSAQNPTHSFRDEGDFEVRLTVTNSAGDSDATEEVTVSLNESEPEASFVFSPTNPAVGQAVRFTDTSGGGQPETWEWDFDDDDTSSAQSPTHSFSQEGDYEVRLTVTNSAGGSDVVEEVTVSMTEEAPEANFGYSPSDPSVGQPVSFTDTSGGGAAEYWEWSFGDDETSNEQNAIHAYDQDGSYTVTLRAVNSVGSDSAAKTVVVEVGPILKEITFIPAASLAAGAAGSFYQTDVDIENGSDVLASFAFRWLPRGANNSEPIQSDGFSLSPGASARYPNVLAEVFGFEPDVNGALMIVSDSLDLAVMSRTYNLPTVKVSGTFGQAIAGVPDDELIRTGELGRIIFMSEDPDFRANLGCVNGRTFNTKIFVDLYDNSGSLLETKTMDLAPWSNNQLNKIFKDYAPVNGYAIVRATKAGAAYYCYGSVLDNGSSDPTTIVPVLQ